MDKVCYKCLPPVPTRSFTRGVLYIHLGLEAAAAHFYCVFLCRCQFKNSYRYEAVRVLPVSSRLRQYPLRALSMNLGSEFLSAHDCGVLGARDVVVFTDEVIIVIVGHFIHNAIVMLTPFILQPQSLRFSNPLLPVPHFFTGVYSYSTCQRRVSQ